MSLLVLFILRMKGAVKLNKPMVVTFSGQAQHGKDTSLEMLKENLESSGAKVHVTGFADRLKQELLDSYGWNGLKDEAGRSLLQRVGQERRNQLPDYWVDKVIEFIEGAEPVPDYVLIRDARYPNEINKLKRSGYKTHTVHVTRLGFDNGLTDEQKAHPSELALAGYMFDSFFLAQNLEELSSFVETLVSSIFAERNV